MTRNSGGRLRRGSASSVTKPRSCCVRSSAIRILRSDDQHLLRSFIGGNERHYKAASHAISVGLSRRISASSASLRASYGERNSSHRNTLGVGIWFESSFT